MFSNESMAFSQCTRKGRQLESERPWSEEPLAEGKDGPAQALMVSDGTATREVSCESNEGYCEELAYLIDCYAGKKQPVMADAPHRSLTEKRVILLNETEETT